MLEDIDQGMISRDGNGNGILSSQIDLHLVSGAVAGKCARHEFKVLPQVSDSSEPTKG